MEDNTNGTILLDVSMDDLIASLKELKRQYDENTAAMEKLAKAGEKDSDEYVRLTQANKELRGEMRGVETQIQNEIKAERAQEGSLIQLRAQLANLTRQYDAMSAAERASASGMELQNKIKGLSDEILGLEGSTGRWQRNVGNYKSALEGLSGSFQAAGINAGGLGKAITALKSGNPVIAGVTVAVSGLTAAVKRLSEEFKDNEAAAMEMHETMAAVEVQTYANKRAWNSLADWFNTVWRTTVDGLVVANYKLLGVMDAISNFFGGDSDAAGNYARQTVLLRQVAREENNLVKDTRRWEVQEAQLRNQIADLRQKSYDKEKYTAEQRAAFLDQIEAKELYISRQRENLAKREYEIQKTRSVFAENSKEENDRLAAAEKKVIEANTEFLTVQGQINRRRSQTAREIQAETKAVKENAQALREQLEMIEMLSLSDAAREAAKGNQELADSIRETADAVGELKNEMSGLQGLDTHVLQDIPKDVEDGPGAIEQLAASFSENAKEIEETSAAVASSFGSLSAMYRQMASDESKSEEEREEAARKAQMWARLQIAANSGTAIAKGVASAMDVPFPANLAAIATTLAAIVSAIAQAKALASEGHASGGPVGNRFAGATMGPDNTYIAARRGEMVLNASQQRQLFELANGTGSTGLAAQLASALRAMPAPVLDYSEFTAFQDRVASINENARIR